MRTTSFLKTAAALVTVGTLAWGAHAAIMLTNTVTGAPLELSEAPEEGRDTEAVKTFLATGTNIYNEKAVCLPKAHELFLSMCSGCHGHYAEGKIGPGLNDSYWTYPKNETDQGLFETIFGGAQGQMGPMYGALNMNEMLLVMAWVRHVYKGDPQSATWLTAEQRSTFKPFNENAAHIEPAEELLPQCGGPAG
ncbi:cytochrome c(L), periplasmic [Ancylobacter sp. SL191]|uniref:cytochrome c(L), periplasmic n=1 Tax=Ancylobacter sp. SL191 TaxID=2995166 RepID=UPI00226F819F|nr:cytochrome c(L), periplasmic [Ancylobacter sp. SL191]WAC26231.1 cytochrome c(L), periplasmic [Ancylobacter sp. SL191]